MIMLNMCEFVCLFFLRVKFPSGGFAHLWCLVFSDHPNVSYYITAGKVSILQSPGFLCRSRTFQKAYWNKECSRLLCNMHFVSLF